MTGEEFWKSWLAFGLLGGPILLGYASFAISLYLSRRHLDSLLEALQNSRQIAISAAGLLHHGWYGRMMLVAKITFMVMWPGPGLRAGDLDPEDIRQFPLHLKLWLKAKAVLTMIILIWGAVAFALLKFK